MRCLDIRMSEFYPLFLPPQNLPEIRVKHLPRFSFWGFQYFPILFRGTPTAFQLLPNKSGICFYWGIGSN